MLLEAIVPVSSWTHPICEECWFIEHPDVKREPFRLRTPQNELCCFCREWTHSGIYARADPVPLGCTHD